MRWCVYFGACVTLLASREVVNLRPSLANSSRAQMRARVKELGPGSGAVSAHAARNSHFLVLVSSLISPKYGG